MRFLRDRVRYYLPTAHTNEMRFLCDHARYYLTQPTLMRPVRCDFYAMRRDDAMIYCMFKIIAWHEMQLRSYGDEKTENLNIARSQPRLMQEMMRFFFLIRDLHAMIRDSHHRSSTAQTDVRDDAIFLFDRRLACDGEIVIIAGPQNRLT